MPTLPIPSDFVTSYNGFVFPPEDTVTTAFKVTPIESPDGRTVMANRISIGLRTIIMGQPTDDAALAIRHKLTKFGGVLIYGGRGLGPLSINTGKVRDVNYGPKPREVAIKPLGYRNAFKLDWQVETTIPECPDAQYRLTPMAMAYTVTFKLRRNGRVDREISGELTIPNNRTKPGALFSDDSPDRHRELICPPVAFGFHREFQPWKIDPSRTKMTFGWTDKEFDRNVYPPGFVAVESSQSVRSLDAGPGFNRWGVNLAATYTLAADASPQMAELHFFKVIVKDRLYDRKNPGVSYIPQSFEASDANAFGDETQCRFSLTYNIVGSSLRDILKHSGMWETYTKDRKKAWTEWSASLKNSALNPLGFSRLTFSIADDEIVDLCKGKAEVAGGSGGKEAQPWKGQQVFDNPLPESSWLDWQNSIRVESDTGTVSMLPLSTAPTGMNSGGQGGPTATGEYQLELDAIQGAIDGVTGGVKDISKATPTGSFSSVSGQKPPVADEPDFTRRTGPAIYVYLKGYAIRAGYEIPCITLKDIDGVKCRLANRLDKGEGFHQAIIKETTVPIVGAKWNLRYELASMPKRGIPIPLDPTKPSN